MKAVQIIQSLERRLDKVGWDLAARRMGLNEDHLRKGLRGKQGHGPNLRFLQRLLDSLQMRMVLTYRIDRIQWEPEDRAS